MEEDLTSEFSKPPGSSFPGVHPGCGRHLLSSCPRLAPDFAAKLLNTPGGKPTRHTASPSLGNTWFVPSGRLLSSAAALPQDCVILLWFLRAGQPVGGRGTWAPGGTDRPP